MTIGVIELFPNPHFAHARKGIEDYAKKHDIDVIIQNANLDATKEAQYIQTFITRQVDAILVSAVSPTGSLAALRWPRPPTHRSSATQPASIRQMTRNLHRRSSRATTQSSARQRASRLAITSRQSSAARPRSDSGDVLMQWAVAGLGIVNTPSFLIGNELEEGRLETILDEYSASDVGVYVVRPPGTAVPAKVRTLIDNLIRYFRAEQL